MRLGVSENVPHGSAVEFYCTEDVYVIISICPYGNAKGMAFTKEPIQPVPVYISVWDTAIEPIEPPNWKDWQAAFWDMVASGEKKSSLRTGPESYKEP